MLIIKGVYTNIEIFYTINSKYQRIGKFTTNDLVHIKLEGIVERRGADYKNGKMRSWVLQNDQGNN